MWIAVSSELLYSPNNGYIILTYIYIPCFSLSN